MKNKLFYLFSAQLFHLHY